MATEEETKRWVKMECLVQGTDDEIDRVANSFGDAARSLSNSAFRLTTLNSQEDVEFEFVWLGLEVPDLLA